MLELRAQWQCICHPGPGFQRQAIDSPSLIDALSRMLLWRVPLALAEGALACWSLASLYRSISDPTSALWQALSGWLPPEMDLREIQALLRELPPCPEPSRVLPWVALLVPVYVLSLWLHNAVWDHGCLWLLKGVPRTGGFRRTLVAEAEVLTVGTLGALAGLLIYLPMVGPLFTLPVALLGAYFWILRGFALAAFHGCPVWKAVMATLLHGALLLCGSLLMLLLLGLVLILA